MTLKVIWLRCSFIWTQGRLFKKATEIAFISLNAVFSADNGFDRMCLMLANSHG